MFLLLALVAAVPVQPVNLDSWVTYEDYPPAALRGDEMGYVGFSVLVAPDGKPSRCEISAPAPFNDLNDLTCRLVMRRAKFEPATDEAGQPTYGLFRNYAIWLVADNPSAMELLKKRFPEPSKFDFGLSLNRMPVGLAEQEVISLAVVVDANGSAGGCYPIDSRASETLGKFACEQLAIRWKPLIGRDAAGKSLSTVQEAKVAFEAGSPNARRIDTPPPHP